MTDSRGRKQYLATTIQRKIQIARRLTDRPFSKLAIYLLLLTFVTLVLFWRFPNNITHANFYAEDGSVFLQNILDKGWLKAALTPFNGYAIIGLYLLEAIAWIVNLVFIDGTLLTLASAFALTAVSFLAVVICLPYLLFGKVFGKKRMLLVVLFSTLLPLPLAPHIVIGTIGNVKWAFMYLAFLLVIYRVINHGKLKRPVVAVVDSLLLISAYTNSTVYALIPILLIPYVQDYWLKRKKRNLIAYLKYQLKNFEFVSLVILGVLLIPQVLYVGLHGIPKLPGYLDTPFQMNRTVEIFINRTYVFGITHYINSHLSNILVILIFTMIVYFGIKRLKGSERFTFLTGLYSAGVASLLFVINRPGVSAFFIGYSVGGSGPDQFFYAQTLIMYLPLVLLITQLRFSRVGKICLVLLCGFTVFSGIFSINRFGAQWRHASIFENDAGIFTDRALASCSGGNQEKTTVVVYPHATGKFVLTAPSSEICGSKLSAYAPSVTDLGLRPLNNNYLGVTKDQGFEQTFEATQDNLDGIRIFLSNFGKVERSGSYVLELKDENCKNVLRSVDIPNQLLDNAYYNARFSSLGNSKGVTYCFTVRPTSEQYDPLAIQRSQPDAYIDGELIENSKVMHEDVVFMPLFNPKK